MDLPVVSPWFSRHRVDDTITLVMEPHVVRLQQCNIWHVRGRDRDLIIDTGLGMTELRPAVEDLFGAPVLAVATHFHYDHTGSLHEFDERAIHAAEAELIETSEGIGGTLVTADIPDDIRTSMIDAGYVLDDELLVNAIPAEGYDVNSYAVTGTVPTLILEEGDVIDLGDRAFEVLHLPGHSPGSIGLWEESTGILFSGDALYDGPLLDEVPGADLDDYVRTMERLHELPVMVVHGGHDPSFDRARMQELTRAYLDKRRPSLV
jgi:glyoxylase-like metal-dependent hydrolase (beta-lactamase superfamily II)